MVQFYNNLSPTTKLLIQSFLAVLGSVLAGVATAVYQSYVLSQQLNLALLWNVAIVTFALLFGKAMHDWVPGHAQQLIQAYQDNEARLQDALQRQQSISSAVIATQGSLVQTNSPQAQIQPLDVQALSQQLALNLMNMAANNGKVPASADPMPMPVKPVPAEVPYEDPLAVSAKLPAYTPSMGTLSSGALAGGTAVQNSQVTFSAPARPMP